MRAVVNRVLALLVGIAVIALAVGIIVEVLAVLADAEPVLVDWPEAYSWAQRTTWGDDVVLVTCVVLAVAGLALLIGQLWPTRVRRLAIESPDPATDAAITRRGLARDLTAAVNKVDGVTPEKVKVRRRRVTVRAATRGADTAAVRETVTTSVRDRLERLHLRRPPRLAVNVSTVRRS